MSTLWSLREALEDRADTVRLTPDAIDVAVRRGQEMRRRRRLVGGGLLAVATAAVIVPIAFAVAAPDSDLDPARPSPSASEIPPATPTALADLPLGAPLTIPYAIGDVFVDGDVRILMPGVITDVVRIDERWAVTWQTDDPGIRQLDLVSPDGSREMLDQAWINGVAAGPEINNDGSVVWGRQPTLQGGPGEIRLHNTDGFAWVVHDSIKFGEGDLPPAVVGLSGDRVVFTPLGEPGGPPLAWRLNTTTTEPLVEGVTEFTHLIELTRDGRVALVYDSQDGSEPDGPACVKAIDLNSGSEFWQLCDGQLGALSPDGRSMWNGTSVVDGSSGQVVQSFELPLFAPGAGWEDADHVLITGDLAIGQNGPVTPLVRCSIATGACERVPLDGNPGSGVRIMLGRP